MTLKMQRAVPSGQRAAFFQNGLENLSVCDKMAEKTQKEGAELMGISQSYISRLGTRIMLRLRREISRQLCG